MYQKTEGAPVTLPPVHIQLQIKPKLSFIEEEEKKLDVENLIAEALETLEEIRI